MKILHIRSSGGMYGAEAVILNLVSTSQKLGFGDHQIVCLNNSKNPHVELVDLAKSKGLMAYSVECKGMFDRNAIKEIRGLIEVGKYNVLHTHDYKATVFGFLASRKLKVKRVSTNHLWTHDNLKLRCYEVLEGILFNWFDRIVAVSDPVAKEVRPFLLDRKKLSVISNAIDCEKFVMREMETLKLKDSDEFVVGIVGRLNEQKGHVFLLNAIKKVKGKNEKLKIKVLIAGTGPLEDKLKLLSKDLDIEKQVEFLGFCDDVCSMFDRIDALAMPSLSEGLPIVILEAMAVGVPVIATPVGDIPKLIKQGETGFLVEPRNSDQLARRLELLIENKISSIEDRKSPTDSLSDPLDSRFSLKDIIKNARNLVVDKYSAESMARNYFTLYKELV